MRVIYEKIKKVKDKIFGFVKKNQKWFWLGIESAIMAFVLYMVSASSVVCACAFIATGVHNLLTNIYKKRKWLWLLSWPPMLIPFFCNVQMFAAGVSFLLFIVMTHYWNKSKRKLEWIASVVLSIGMYFIIEYMQQNFRPMWLSFFYIRNILHYGHLYGLLVLASTFFLFHIFFSKKVSWYITIGFYSIFAIVNFFVVAFTSQGFIPSDLKIATTAMGVLDQQQLTGSDIIRLIIGIVCIGACVLVATFAFKKEPKGSRKDWQKFRTFMCISLLVLMTWSTCSWLKNNLLLFNAHSKYGFISNFIVNLDSKIHFPDGVEEYMLKDEDAESTENTVTPNVIIVMSEALSDLKGTFNLGGEENLSYMKSLMEKFPSGIAYSSVKGNNTCSSEWESLSGVSTGLTVKGAVVYQDNCVNMNSLANVFNRRGYSTVGIHPYRDYGYNRKTMWETLGFQKTVFEDGFEQPEMLRKYITDEENYKKIIQEYESNELAGDAPFFCFNITMMNHGGYDIAYNNVAPYDTTTCKDVNQYLSLVNTADQQLKTLIEYFENVDEPTVILIFGDHQPSVDNVFYEDYFGTNYESLSTEQLTQVYQVPYLIWANYELDESAAPEETSINYLSAILFDVARMQSTLWLDKVNEYREEWPVVTANFAKDKDGILHSIEQVKGDEILQEYMMYSYGVLKGVETLE